MSKKKKGFQKISNIPTHHIGLTGSHFRKTGFIDYVGARVLISNGLLLQGVVLSSTCIEKYLKAILASVGKRMNSHLQGGDLLTVMRANGVDVTSYISHSFLMYLGRAYKFRYIEPTTGPVSIGIEQRKLLAELDYCVSQFEAALTISGSDGSTRESPYEMAVTDKDKNVWLDNYVLNELQKSDFVEQPGCLYGVFAAPQQEFIEVTHPGFKSTDNSLFEYPEVTAYGNRITLTFGENVEERFVSPGS